MTDTGLDVALPVSDLTGEARLPAECAFRAECGVARKCLGTPTCGRNVIDASRQVIEALDDIQRHPDTYLHWPWAALDHMTGGMAPSDVWYVCAFSGIGKTTFVSSATNRWLDQGKTVFVLPLETRAKRFRTYLACQRLGIKPGDAFSGELRARNDPALPALETELRKHVQTPLDRKLRVAGAQEINTTSFREACQDAADFGADVLIVDHIDHIEAGNGTNLYAESLKVNRLALELAQHFGLLLVLTSQLNTDAVKGQDHLAKFSPPREQHLKYGGHKREVATGMIGLFRPIRGPTNGEDAEEWKAKLKRARSGEIEPQQVLVPHAMGVVYMKDRNYGTDGRKAMLAVVNGRVEDREEKRDDARYLI